MNHCRKLYIANRHQGVVTVEFTLIATIFFLALFSIIGIARVLYIYNATVNATRVGARLAVVCDLAAAANIQTKMAAKVPGLNTSNINLTYNPSGCSVSTCTSVTASISNFTVAIATPASFPLGSFTVPGFSTTLVRESMNSTNNSVCS
ncbi:MAG TPA: TadE/TadG family type IV pilus assembly protein [Methylotenera sp.]|nr:TadE/TadG family type IV pilus assembly protein [Methylotenera sp.]